MKRIFILILTISVFNACKNKNADVLKEDNDVIEGVINEKIINNTDPFAVGKTIIDFTTVDKNGKKIQLSQLYKKNKLVVLDFWSSRCIPCRKENPNLVSLYQQYHSKGFEIVSISVDDDEQNWKNAIEQDGLTWLQICDFKSWKGPLPKQFNITETPTTFLINQEGTIVGINLKGEALITKSKTTFN